MEEDDIYDGGTCRVALFASLIGLAQIYVLWDLRRGLDLFSNIQP